MTKKGIDEEQAERVEKYPPDRIPFIKTASAASEDQKNFRRYIHNEITLQMLCRLVEKTNHLKKVTAEQMKSELTNIGWVQR